MSDFAQRDVQVLWHPFTQMKTAPLAVPVIRGEGTLLFDINGKKYIDAIASWWVNLHGHAHPYIARKVSEQLNTLEHVIFGGFTHPAAVMLAERLLTHIPHQSKVFYSDDGSTAVEVALKMAMQYWHNQGQSKVEFVAFRDSYHGDTFGAMSVSGRSTFTDPFDPCLFKVHFIDPPLKGDEEQSCSQLKEILENNDQIAAFIFEPLVQGTAGMVVHEAEGLEKLIAKCRKHNLIIIADEIMTGFGRTGKWFATDYLTAKPDIMCLSKGITGGTMAFGATTCNEKIYEAFLSEKKEKMLCHGHSYTGNPLACSAGLASLDLMEKETCWQSIRRIEKQHLHFIDQIKNYSGVKKYRQKGVILAMELETPGETSYFNTMRDQLYDFFIERGVLLRPLGNIVYIIPPYCISDEELGTVYKTIIEALDKFYR